MGQRSQIYIRWQKRNGDYVLIARYFQWNFAERMISRARALIEELKESLRFEFQFDGYKEYERKIATFCEVNFDFRDIVLSCDILKEFAEFGEGDSFKDYVFLSQDNNDGKLFIDVDVKGQTIKYCFTDYDLNLLDCREYMNWDYPEWKHNLESYHYSYTIDNLEAIEKTAVLMTANDLKEFIDCDYETPKF